MKRNIIILAVIAIAGLTITAQQSTMSHSPAVNPPYHQIPDYPENYNNVNVVARMIDGLGYRYYWATKDLTTEDLAYRPSEDSRSADETLHHLYLLSLTIKNAPTSTPNIRPLEVPEMTFEEKRAKTLENLKNASDEFKSSKRKDMKDMKLIFKRGEKANEVDFWHMLNGPLADAIYHTGQIVAYRRASGNPMDSGVNVFMGKTRAN